jgi:hypothetical protein
LVLKARTEQWILGRVAVKYSRQIQPTQPVRRPRQLRDFLTTWLDAQPTMEPPCSA